ncbi:uncharacterized protein LOC132203757 isoform X1 [Neocloeon triangulifer]|uniref:uncharacterized protein LOC132203757 isoform X1 n=1 Tax=Neocloeon triangulifer TaxID=2078957 RepID=UPI00286F4101|nr:uncharacterized protein LOC132203757 isoform X1 [Neocloeon triangulifer]XP_059487743.1 uncharacterized protein LOC132203757 isoform X1 [Neocloeon triangulifer]
MSFSQRHIPFMDNPLFKAVFHEPRPDFSVIIYRTLRIENQNTLSSAVYDLFATLMLPRKLAMERSEFIRMWKSLLLARVQQVLRKEEFTEKPLFEPFGTLVPAPLGELLDAIGSFSSQARGGIYRIKPPENKGEDWWKMDNELLRKWWLLKTQMKRHYKLLEFPSKDDVQNRPLMLLLRPEEGQEEPFIKAWTNEPPPELPHLHLVNDPLFEIHHVIKYEHCALRYTNPCTELQYRSAYLASFIEK